jgi:hypothetical protein
VAAGAGLERWVSQRDAASEADGAGSITSAPADSLDRTVIADMSELGDSDFVFELAEMFVELGTSSVA